MSGPSASGGPRDPPTFTDSPPPHHHSPPSASAAAPASNGRRAGKLELASVAVPYGSEKDAVVFYTVNVVTKSGDRWSCQKRFSAFERLHLVLVELFGHRGFPAGADLPPKKPKLFVSHSSEHFITERRVLLDSYLKKMSKVADVTNSDVWQDFLTSDVKEWQAPPVVDESVLDESEVTGVSIPQTRMMSDHVLYQVDVCNARKRKTFSKWTVLKRFGQFYELDQQLRADFAHDPSVLDTLPAAPSRLSKLLYDHMSPHFVAHRATLLEHYLNTLLHMPQLANNIHFLTFLGVRL